MVLRMANPWKHPKTGVYYLRMRVPLDVAAAVGADLIKISLKTKDIGEARLKHSAKLAQLEAQWAQLRKGPQRLDDQQLEALAGELYEGILQRFPSSDRGHAVGHHVALMRFLLEAALGKFADEPALQHLLSDRRPAEQIAEVIGSQAQSVLARHGLKLDDQTKDRFLIVGGRAALQAAKHILRECKGDFTPDPKRGRFPALERPTAKEEQTKAAGLSFEDAWKHVSVGYATATCKRWRPILESLMESAEKSDVMAITEADVEGWKERGLAAGGVSRRSFARNNLSAVKTFFGKLKDLKEIPANPTVEIKVLLSKKHKGRDMRGFRNEEAFAILNATLVPPPDNLSKHYANARRWVPWLCAYTGARVNEITQARACDVRRSEGYFCILITPEAGTQKTCTKREVPLHEHLIEQGFLEFVHTKASDEPLFALRSTPGKTSPSELVGAHLAKWVRSLGVADEDVAPNHGWRHRFKTEARGHFSKVEFIDAIQGHVPDTEGGKYGEYPPRILGPEIAKLPRIQLPSERKAA